MSHSVDLAHMLVGPIARVVGTTETFIRERRSRAGRRTHYGRGRPGDPTGAVTNEDYAGMLCVFENGARGTFEAGRTLLGPESQMAFDLHGDAGALGWNLERMNELQVYLATDERTPATPRCSAASASRTTAPSCRAAPTGSASRTWS